MSGKILFPKTLEEYGELYVSPHFQLKEFYHTDVEWMYEENRQYFFYDISCVDDSHVFHSTLVSAVLEEIREKSGFPVIITSGFRCDKLNKVVKGSKNSQHMWKFKRNTEKKDKAIDFTLLKHGEPVSTEHLRDVWKGIKRSKRFKYHQLIFYPATEDRSAFIHYGWPIGVDDMQAWEEK